MLSQITFYAPVNVMVIRNFVTVHALSGFSRCFEYTICGRNRHNEPRTNVPPIKSYRKCKKLTRRPSEIIHKSNVVIY